MQRFLKYLAISIGLLGLLGIGYISYLRINHFINCPTTERPTPLSLPKYPQIIRSITEVTETYHDGERGEHIFFTTDTPEAVVAFYTTSLRAQGWRETRRDIDHRGYQLVKFSETRFLPVYFLNLYTNVTQDGTTVEVISGSDRNPCLGR